MTRPRTRIQQKNSETILEAALDVFSTYGFRGATLDQIAEVAGLSKPNLLYYFPSKEAVHRELLTGLLDTWLDPLKAMDPMNSGGTTDQGEFSVTLTIAFHSSATMDENGITHDLGLPHGIVVTPKIAGEPTIYHMGDTEVFSDMALIDELHKPDVAIVPVGDRFTMDGRRGALAVRRFLPSVKTAIPCHFGTFGLIAPNADTFVQGMQGAAARVLVPEKGVPFTL